MSTRLPADCTSNASPIHFWRGSTSQAKAPGTKKRGGPTVAPELFSFQVPPGHLILCNALRLSESNHNCRACGKLGRTRPHNWSKPNRSWRKSCHIKIRQDLARARPNSGEFDRSWPAVSQNSTESSRRRRDLSDSRELRPMSDSVGQASHFALHSEHFRLPPSGSMTTNKPHVRRNPQTTRAWGDVIALSPSRPAGSPSRARCAGHRSFRS